MRNHKKVIKCFLISFVILILCFLCSCSTFYGSRIIEKGDIALDFSAGGPFVNIGVPVPLPNTTIGARYGIQDNLDIGMHLYPTCAYFGLFGIDIGNNYRILEEDSIFITTSENLYYFTNFKKDRLFVDWTLISGKSLYFDKFVVYLVSNIFILNYPFKTGWSCGIGTNIELLENFYLLIETRWLLPYEDNSYTGIKWIGPFNRGVLSINLGVNYVFKK
jgi:hypothetical protein